MEDRNYMKYFVCFCYENEREGRIEFGNAGIELEKAVTKPAPSKNPPV